MSLVLLTTGGTAWAQAAPIAPPTANASVQALERRTPAPARRAEVSFTGGLLIVSANNSSLNQILRDISRVTGMKITGGVGEERVFGTYGPSEPGTVLSALLSGTGSNMLMVSGDGDFPQQLVLTPRQGGPTPPNPNALSGSEGDLGEGQDLPPQLSPRVPRPPFPGNGIPQVQPPPGPPAEMQPGGFPSPPQGAGIPPAEQLPASQLPPTEPTQQPGLPGAPPVGTTTEESPNGVKTPQQIYDQLLKMQQQQKNAPSTRVSPN